ncbi:MAG TPA: transglycosylase SLT domain-containing protein [Rhodocyclaceae bacterium]|nr:transglycosylase SLT domain-containing protein [Rhodocyclaceae bacterium]
MKRPLWLLLFLFPLLAAAAPGDEYILAARAAYRNGERLELAEALRALKDQGNEANVLEPWAEYWQLSQRIADDGVLDGRVAADVNGFLERQANTYPAEKLRREWLKALGKGGQWQAFEDAYPLLQQPDQELVCYAAQSRLALYQDSAALEALRPQWFSAADLPESCMPLMAQLITAGRISERDIWERMRRLLAAKKLDQAEKIASYLPKRQAPQRKTLLAIAERPRHYLDDSLDSAHIGRLKRELLRYAVERLARVDAMVAASEWQKIQGAYSVEERGHVWGRIAMAAARAHLPQALTWYGYAEQAPLSEEQIAWQARAALREEDWPTLERVIGRMPAQLAARPAWIYWRGRAMAAQGRADAARALYLGISGQANFYGMLAADELGRPLVLPPPAPPPSAQEMAAARDNPGLQRALALIRLGIRIEGVREWNWTLRGMDDRQLLAAAALADDSEVFDRAISTADRTLAQHDYALRYPAPFRALVDPQAKILSLDHGWVYGLMRQESRFVMNARSGVGAKGLMQLMPSTARWVAKKIGMKDYRPAKAEQLDTNVELGTHYLSMVLTSLGNCPVLASAAYNAGPRRARRWCAARPLEGAIYVETIPFSETRDYVKKVMTNAVYYAALFEDRPVSLKSRLGVVGPMAGEGGAYLP